MKNILTFILMFVSFLAAAQEDVQARLAEAKTSHEAGDLEAARYALQQSIAALDALICQEILESLPTELSGLSYIPAEDYISGNAMGIVGSSVQRRYGSEAKSINFNLMNNSPMMSMVTAFLTNPLFANSADGSQKQIKIAGIKAVLQKNMEAEDEFTIQVPINQSLLTLEYTKFTEQEAISAAESLNLDEIKNILN